MLSNKLDAIQAMAIHARKRQKAGGHALKSNTFISDMLATSYPSGSSSPRMRPQLPSMVHTPPKKRSSALTIERSVVKSAKVSEKQDAKTDKTTPPKSKKNILIACMGKPTFTTTMALIDAAIDFWNAIKKRAKKAYGLFEKSTVFDVRLSNISDELVQEIMHVDSAVDYSHPQGHPEAREIFAEAISNQHQANEIKSLAPLVEPKDVVFNVGGSSGLSLVFNALHSLFPGDSILTTKPYYSLYKHAKNPLRYIDVMHGKTGYRLTPQHIRNALKQAKQQNVRVCALLICDPNNPTGTVIQPDEWKEIGQILKENPGLYLVHDAAYAFMLHSGDWYQSLLAVAPEMKDRLIMLYSGTKSFSASGERYAATLIFNQKIRQRCVGEISKVFGGTPLSSQFIFSRAMMRLTSIDMQRSCNYYKKQVDNVLSHIKNLRIGMPSLSYQPKGAFYVLCQLKELYGQPLAADVANHFGLPKDAKACTDEQLAYNLIHQDGLAIAPLSYFGANPEDCFFRITCSIGNGLHELMRRLAKRLRVVRKARQRHLLGNLMARMKTDEFFNKVYTLIVSTPHKDFRVKNDEAIAAAKLLYDQNAKLAELLNEGKSPAIRGRGDKHDAAGVCSALSVPSSSEAVLDCASTTASESASSSPTSTIPDSNDQVPSFALGENEHVSPDKQRPSTMLKDFNAFLSHRDDRSEYFHPDQCSLDKLHIILGEFSNHFIQERLKLSSTA